MATFEDQRIRSVVERLRKQTSGLYDTEYFTNHYWREDLPGMRGNGGLSYDDAGHTRRFDFLYRTIVDRYDPGTLLDAGSGPGLIVERALSRGLDARGIDLSCTAKAMFDSRTPSAWHDRFEVGAITALPFHDRTFELTMCLDVLEHLIVFDIFQAVAELCRVSANHLVCSINLDNPYKFHPTILSRDSWVALFDSADGLVYDTGETDELNSTIQASYPEYEIFVFNRKQ